MVHNKNKNPAGNVSYGVFSERYTLSTERYLLFRISMQGQC